MATGPADEQVTSEERRRAVRQRLQILRTQWLELERRRRTAYEQWTTPHAQRVALLTEYRLLISTDARATRHIEQVRADGQELRRVERVLGEELLRLSSELQRATLERRALITEYARLVKL